MTTRSTQWSAKREGELKTLTDAACAAVRENKRAYETLLETSRTAHTYDEKKHAIKLLTVALEFWMVQVEKCRVWRRAYVAYKRPV